MQIKYLTIIIVILMSIMLVSSSSTTLGIFKKNECINLKQTCSNCSSVNITSVVYPNSSIIISNVEMTKSGTEFNYTLCNTSVTGIYTVNGVGNPDGLQEIFIYDFTVTTSGYQASTPQALSMFLIIGIFMFVIILFFIFGLKTDYLPAKIFCLSLSVVLIVFLIGYIMAVANITIGEFSSLTEGFTPLYIIFISLLTVGGVGIVVYLIYVSFTAFYKYRGLREWG